MAFLGPKVIEPDERLEKDSRKWLQDILNQVNSHIDYCHNSGLAPAYDAARAQKRLRELLAGVQQQSD